MSYVFESSCVEEVLLKGGEVVGVSEKCACVEDAGFDCHAEGVARCCVSPASEEIVCHRFWYLTSSAQWGVYYLEAMQVCIQ